MDRHGSKAHLRPKRPSRTDSHASERSSALAPPQYGIDFVDNATRMPGLLRSGLEHLSGVDLSSVRVHYDSAKPAQLQALAYTLGRDIYLGPGQERHLAHEGWHAVQQLQGRVAAAGPINDDPALEREADDMGAQAQALGGSLPAAPIAVPRAASAASGAIQRVKWGNLALGGLATAGTLGLAWASRGFRRFMRDAWYGTVRLTEEQSAAAQRGQIIEYSPLAAGCMAVTATFVGGGGAGVHLAMMPQAPNQWANFIAAVGANAVAQVYVDTEFLGEDQGWYVNPGAAQPASLASLMFTQNLTAGQIAAAGWTCAAPAVLAWIAAQLGVPAANVQHSQNTQPWYVMP